MSPLYRSRGSSSYRGRPTRRRTFRTQWVGFSAGSGALPPDTSIHLELISNAILMSTYGLNQPTLIRIRGELLVTLGTGAPTTTEQANVYIGMHVIDSDDAVAGGNPDDAFSVSNSNQWLFHRSVYVASFPTIDTRNPLLSAARYEVDVKSRRKIQINQSLAVAYSSVPVAANPAGSVGCIIQGRALFHEFGR